VEFVEEGMVEISLYGDNYSNNKKGKMIIYDELCREVKV